MRCLLMERGLWGFVSGDIKKPEVKVEDKSGSSKDTSQVADKIDDYQLRADKAYSLIALSVDKQLQVHVSSKNTAKEAWEGLQNQFEFVSVNQIVRLTRRFYAGKMEEGGDLMKHITEMTSLAEQLKEMKEDISSKKFAIVMLGSLPDSYETFLTSMNARDAANLDWNNIKGALIEEFLKRQDKDSSKKNDDEAFFSRGVRGRNGRSRGSFVRGGGSNGGRFLPYAQRGVEGSFKGTCFECNEVGHKRIACPNKRKDGYESNFADHDTKNVDWRLNERHVADEFNNAFTSKLQNERSFADECEKDDVALMLLNEESKLKVADVEECMIVSSRKHEWYIDSGASKHMTNNIEILTDINYYNNPSPVYLGDESVVFAHGEGQSRVRMANGVCLALKNVLFVPKLVKNLLSVRAMTNQGAQVRFIGDKCMVYKNGKDIEIGRSINGSLYKFITPVVPPTCADVAYLSSTQSLDVWHQRYGHLNLGDLKQILKNDNIVKGMKICDVNLVLLVKCTVFHF